MTSDEILDLQIKLYRQMTGEQRLMIALRLHEEWVENARADIVRDFPNASEREVLLQLRKRIDLEKELSRMRSEAPAGLNDD